MNCSICLELLCQDKDKTIATTLCGHKFHKECLNKWYKQKYTYYQSCPLCRQIDYSDEEFNSPPLSQLILGNISRLFKLN